MKKHHIIAAALVLAAHAARAASLDIEVGYDFSVASSSGLYVASPDSGFVDLTANGSSFVGTFDLVGTAANGVVVHDLFSGTLASGTSWRLVAGLEGSNQGGWNKVAGAADNGLELLVSGLLDGCPISLDIFDKDIHSGSPRTNPFGVTLDNYILQGGDPIGRDTGDPYEVTQAHATLSLVANCNQVPESGSTAVLLGSGLAALALFRRKVS